MRYVYAALAAILMTGCASSPRTATGPDAGASQPAKPQAAELEQPVPQAATVAAAKILDTSDVVNVQEAPVKGTDTPMGGSASLKNARQVSDPLQCLLAWVQNGQKNNPYLKTFEASPPNN